MITVFLGAPGTGKGTLASMLKEQDGYIHISTGELFRYNMKNQTELGVLVQDLINQGKLINDDVTFAMLVDSLEKLDLQKDKVILDGFPRTIPQADMLAKYVEENNIEFSKVINFDLKKETIIERLSSRMFDPETGRTYSKHDLPEGISIDQLQQRPDDQPANIEVRFKAYEIDTKPLINYYLNLDMLTDLDVNIPKEVIKDKILGVLN